MTTPVEKALAAWNSAPVHVQLMAGTYVKPLIAALADLEKRVTTLEEKANVAP